MMKISTKKSVLLSMALSIAFFAMIAVIGVALPFLSGLIFDVIEVIKNHTPVSDFSKVFIFVIFYSLLFIATAANILLFALLLRIRDGKIFTSKSVAYIRGISWCCILFGLCAALFTPYFMPILFFSFAMIFVGLCIRVVKNAVEEATELKSENDLTV